MRRLTQGLPRPTPHVTTDASSCGTVAPLDGAGQAGRTGPGGRKTARTKSAKSKSSRSRKTSRARVTHARTRAAPVVYARQDALDAMLRRASPSMRAAALLIAEDLLTHAIRVRGPVHHGANVVERGPAYYAACGKLPEGLARQAVSMLVRELAIPRIPVEQVRQLGVPVRQLKPGKHRGRYLLIRPSAHQGLTHATRILRRDGVTPPEPTRPQPILGPGRKVDIVRRGRHSFIRCPDPEHEDKDPSALVNPDGAVYCFGPCCQRIVAYVEDVVPDPQSLGEGEYRQVRARLVLDWRANRDLRAERRARDLEREIRAAKGTGPTGSATTGAGSATGAVEGDPADAAHTEAPTTREMNEDDVFAMLTQPAPAPADRGAGPHRGCYAGASSGGPSKSIEDTAIHGAATPTPAQRKIAIRVAGRSGLTPFAPIWSSVPAGARAMTHIGDPADPHQRVRETVDEKRQQRLERRRDARDEARKAAGKPPVNRKAKSKRVAGPVCTDLCMGYVTAKKSPGWFRRTLSSQLDLLDILRRAQRRNCTEVEWTRAVNAELTCMSRVESDPNLIYDLTDVLPDLYVTLHHHIGIDWRETRWGGLAPRSYKPAAVRWIGVDLDRLSGLFTGELEKRTPLDLTSAARAIERWCESRVELTGRIGFVRTSSTGVQVVAELAATRWTELANPYQDPALVRLHDQLDAVCLEAVRAAGATEGKIDRSIRAPGRYIRLPGPRAKFNRPEFAELIYASP